MTTTSFETGIRILDEEASMLDPGQLILLKGRPGAGKTNLLAGLISRAAKSGSVLVNNVEMTPNQFLPFLLAAEGQFSRYSITHSWTMTPKEQDEVNEALSRLGAAPIHFMRTFDLAALEASIIETKPQLVVVDYLNLFTPPSNWKGTRAQYLVHVTKELAQMSRTHKTSIIVAESQNRTGADSTSNAASGTEESADQVWILTRHDSRHTLELGKNRGGPSHLSQEITLDEKTGTFRDPVELPA